MEPDPRALFRDLVAELLTEWPLQRVVVARDTGPVPARGRVYPHLRCNLVRLGRQHLACGSGGSVQRHQLPPMVAFVGLPHSWDRTLRRRYECRTLGLAFGVGGVRLVTKDFRCHVGARPDGPDHELQLAPDAALDALAAPLSAIARERRDADAVAPLLDGLRLAWRLVADRLAAGAPEPLDPARARWHQARRWMQEHCHQPIGREAVARAVGITPSHCSVLFRRFDGGGFHRTLTAMRLERAQALLRDPALGIADIAVRSGFEHPTTFARAFRRLTGYRPSEWRCR